MDLGNKEILSEMEGVTKEEWDALSNAIFVRVLASVLRSHRKHPEVRLVLPDGWTPERVDQAFEEVQEQMREDEMLRYRIIQMEKHRSIGLKELPSIFKSRFR